FALQLLQGGLGALAFGDIHDRAEKLPRIARIMFDGMAQGFEVLARSVGQDNEKFNSKIAILPRGALNFLLDPSPIVRLHSLHDEVIRRLCLRRIDAKDPKRFLRPKAFSTGNAPTPVALIPITLRLG